MLHRNGKEIEQIFRNGREIALLYKNGVIIYDKRGHATVTKTFQDLIDEGYVTIARTWPNGDSYSQGWVGRAVGLTVSANCPYTLDQITDFAEVFNSTKMVSFGGVVGEGTLPNAFLWPQNHWLTDDEVYTLYNNVTLSHDVIGLQFKYLNWANKGTVTIKYNSESGNWYFTDSGVFGPNMPATINIDVGDRRFSSTAVMFGRHNKLGDSVTNPMSNTVTLNWITLKNNGVNDTVRTAAGMFEGATKLTTFTGISFGSCPDLSNTFNGCSALVTIPQTAASSGFNSVTNMQQCFKNCVNLETIVPRINAQAVTNNTDVFYGDVELETFSLYHINASANNDWHLEDTIIDQNSADYIVTNVYENVDTSAAGFVYKNIYFPNTVTITQAQVIRLYTYGWNCYVNGQLINPYTFNISYVDGENNQNITGALPSNETIHTNVYTIPQSNLAWTNHGLAGYSETKYPAYSDFATSVYAPGSQIAVDHDMTLYPVWNTTFQGLIDEGYVTLITDYTYCDSNVQPMRVANNHYAKELVTDLNDVFLSTNNKMVSSAGVVGDGTKYNVFLHDQSNLWLTSAEWYSMYNNTALPYWPQNNQFNYMDWGDYNNMTLIFRGSGVPFNNAGGSQNTFFRNGRGPTNLTIDFGTATVRQLNVAFRHSGLTFHTQNITFVGENSGSVQVVGSMQGTFENCTSLRTVSGLDISGARDNGNNQAYGNTFQACTDLVTIPASISSTGGTSTLSTCTAMNNMFKGCTSLTEIGVILNVANITANTDVFLGDSNLTTFYLNGINAQKNQDWDLSGTAINSTSIAYLVTNLTEWSGFDPSTNTYKNIMFPANASISDAQITRLRANGWKPYKNGIELYPAA